MKRRAGLAPCHKLRVNGCPGISLRHRPVRVVERRWQQTQSPKAMDDSNYTPTLVISLLKIQEIVAIKSANSGHGSMIRGGEIGDGPTFASVAPRIPPDALCSASANPLQNRNATNHASKQRRAASVAMALTGRESSSTMTEGINDETWRTRPLRHY